MNESFWTLLKSAAHWEFEIFLMIVFDGLILGSLWPFLRKHYIHHLARDQRDNVYCWSMNPVAQKAGHIQMTPFVRPDLYDDIINSDHLTMQRLADAMLDRYPPFDDLVSDQKTPKTVDDDITKA